MSRIARGALAVAPALAALGAYASALGADLVFDDQLFLSQRCWQIGGLGELGRALSEPPCDYRPVRYLSLALDHLAWGGASAFGMHLTNVVLHALTALLVVGLLRRLGLGLLGAACGALVWALHPVHTDAVTYVAGRRDVLFALFALGGLLAWPRGLERAPLRVAIACACFVLAFETKEMAITLPALILLERSFAPTLDATRRGVPLPSPLATLRGALRAQRVGFAVLAVLTVAGFVHRAWLSPVTRHAARFWGGDVYHHVLTIPAAYARYAEWIVWPQRLIGDHSDYPPASGLADARVWIGAVVLVAIWGGGIALARRLPHVAFGLLWLGVALLPVSQLVPHHEPVAEHYLYLPLVGLGLAAGRGLELAHATGSRQRLVAGIALLAVAMLFAARIQARNREFASEESFARAILARVPGSPRGHLTLASGLRRRHRTAEAAGAWRFVIAHTRAGDSRRREAEHNLLSTLATSGELVEAERLADDVLARAPADAHALSVLGTLRARQGRGEEAVRLQREALRLDPHAPEIRLNLAATLIALGRIAEAAPHAEAALDALPWSPQASLLGGIVAEAGGDRTLARRRYERAAALAPAMPGPREQLARMKTEDAGPAP